MTIEDLKIECPSLVSLMLGLSGNKSGAIALTMEQALREVIDDLNDPNKPPAAKRGVTFKFTFTPDVRGQARASLEDPTVTTAKRKSEDVQLAIVEKSTGPEMQALGLEQSHTDELAAGGLHIT